MKLKLIILLTTIFFGLLNELKSSNNIIFNDETELLDISSFLSILEDKSNSLSFEDVRNKEFIKTESAVPNLGISKSDFWIKILITNNTTRKDLFLELSLPIIDHIEFYSQTNGKHFNVITTGDEYPFYDRKYNDPNYLFDIDIPKGETRIFYLKIRSNEAIQLPMKIGTKTNIYYQIKNRDILSGIYFGIMLVMILYNLFVYFSVRDKDYLYYVVYIIFILLTQSSLQGYTFQYLWPNSLIIAKYSLILFPSLSGITGMYFMIVFLKTREYSKRLYIISLLLMIPYLIAIGLAFFNVFDLSQIIIQLNSGIISIYMLIVPIIIYRKGFKPAKYFIAAWSVFLLGVFIFIFKDMEILPFNNFTRYTMQIGSAVETILLSFALAAKINEYKRGKEESQLQTLEVLKDNEKIIREQNIFLEQ
ncbi:MAG: ATPase, partial [Flavobacteriales bacterium]|nr:ATPase [Flavobacteriales bacterium]